MIYILYADIDCSVNEYYDLIRSYYDLAKNLEITNFKIRLRIYRSNETIFEFRDKNDLLMFMIKTGVQGKIKEYQYDY
jgi:hypothetical protein